MQINRTQAILLIIVLLAFILRILAANNISLNPDETIYVTRAMGFVESDRLSVDNQSSVYYVLQDIVFSFFGIGSITSRLLSIIGGALSVVLIFLITKRFYNKNVGLLAAFFFSISGFAIVHNVEMDMFMFFFVMLSMYFLIKANDCEKGIGKNMILSICSYLTAVLIKTLAIPAIVPLVLYHFYQNRNKKIHGYIKVTGFFIALSLLMLSPILTYNYINYKENRVVDTIFSQYLGIKVEEYGYMGIEKTWTWNYFKDKFNNIARSFITRDVFVLLLSFVGAFVSVRRHKSQINYLLIPSLLAFGIFLSIHGSPNHYIIFAIAASIYASIGLSWLIARKKRFIPFLSISKKKFLIYSLLIIFIITIFSVREPLTEKAATNKLQEYFENVDKNNSLIILDVNIYTVSMHWALSNHHFVWGSDFSQDINNYQDDSNQIRINSYFVECPSGDCGWGGRLKHSEMNKANAQKFIRQVYGENAVPVAHLSDDLKDGSYDYKIYKKTITLPKSYLEYIKDYQGFFGYKLNYFDDDQAFDHIDKDKLTIVDGILYSLSKIMLFIDSLLAIGLVAFVGMFLFREHYSKP